MSFFKRKKDKSEIPLPPDERPQSNHNISRQDPNQARQQLFASSSSGAPRQNGSAYDQTSSSGRTPSIAPSYASTDPYARAASSSASGSVSNYNKPVMDKKIETDPARAALFSGYNPAAIPREVKRQVGGRDFGDDNNQGGDEEQDSSRGESSGGIDQAAEDEEVEMIKRDLRGVKQETLGSSRNALRIAQEAEETARRTLGQLGEQSEKIANTERNLDMAKAASSRANDKTNELNKLNRSIFVPVVVFNKDRKRREAEQRISDRHIEETAERQTAKLDVLQSQQRLNDGSFAERNAARRRFEDPEKRKEARSRYQFEATESDDELEDELDDNLTETLDVTKRLKALALASGDEIKSHNERLTRINNKAEGLDLKIIQNVERLKNVK
ncbi:SNAP-25 (synaptosome-associated protein) component of SNARE complex [Phaffia rhodozyma]|uniref:SNAP-25 (Synaptosome-associated protein) component of SNARE complex n=1 Tax=Phaffia rhodozyma TaxID=264483 RepID=A0A0F7SIM4_PHARH|nr:SNAP-25 (synaptosome-associated protein) component of SNARE complex [Phaffia rhodozyma]